MNFLLSATFVIVERLLPLLPYSFSITMARVMASLFYYIIPVRKNVARKNLTFIFPEKTHEEISEIIKDTYKNVFTVIVEFFYFRKWKPADFERTLKITNLNLVHEKLKQNKGLIVLSAHFGNWELTAFGGSISFGIPFNVIVKEQSNRFIDKRITRIRENRGNKMIDMKHSAREILRVLHNNGIAAMLGDQSAPQGSKAKVKFFGREITAFEGAALFALKMKVPVLFGVPFRQKDGSYIINAKEIDVSKYDSYSELNASAFMQEYFTLLEESIKQEPAHWLWFHRRFKSQIDYNA